MVKERGIHPDKFRADEHLMMIKIGIFVILLHGFRIGTIFGDLWFVIGDVMLVGDHKIVNKQCPETVPSLYQFKRKLKAHLKSPN